MKKILLACNAGMSTSLLVTRMQKAAAEKGIEAEITAVGVSEAEMIMLDWDIVLLGPQVRHQIKLLTTKADGKVPVKVIDMRDYGLMNGEKVLEDALKAIEEKMIRNNEINEKFISLFFCFYIRF